MRDGNLLSEGEIQEIASCCLLGLNHLHNCNMIHRVGDKWDDHVQDIKPDNLFIFENGLIKVGDFGLSVHLKHSSSRRDTQCGTMWYMAPEVYDGKTEMKSDVWSLGISLIEMADGRNPFQDCNLAMVTKRVLFEEHPTFSTSGWSDVFVDFVNKCLAKDVNDRWSVSQLMEVSAWVENDA